MTTKALIKPGLVRPNDTVTVYSAPKDPYHKDGQAIEVHKLVAEKLVKAGKATLEAPKEEAETKKGGK